MTSNEPMELKESLKLDTEFVYFKTSAWVGNIKREKRNEFAQLSAAAKMFIIEEICTLPEIDVIGDPGDSLLISRTIIVGRDARGRWLVFHWDAHRGTAGQVIDFHSNRDKHVRSKEQLLKLLKPRKRW